MTGHAASSGGPWMVLIGPAGVGKSTLGRILAERVGRSFVDLDAVADPYYQEVDWSIGRLRARIAAVGRLAAEVEWEPARAHAVARVVADHPDAVIALGAGHTSYTRQDNLTSVRTVLRRCRHVVHVLPSPNRDTSLAVLRERCITSKSRTWIVDGHDFLASWLDEPGARLLATQTIYTNSDSPEQTVERLLHAM